MTAGGNRKVMDSDRKLAEVFIDGQNLFHAARQLYGYRYPNYDVHKLAHAVCEANGWQVGAIHFYNGMPQRHEQPGRHAFWTRKLSVMGRQGIHIVNPPMSYHERPVRAWPQRGDSGTPRAAIARVAQEKGVDTSIVADMARAALRGTCDVMVVFSQDRDLKPGIALAKEIATSFDRTLSVACAYPSAPEKQARGIDTAIWLPFDQRVYDQCIDHRDYRAAILDQNEYGELPEIIAARAALSLVASPAVPAADNSAAGTTRGQARPGS